MGHDLITIYWLKAVEYILALSYLPLFILFWKFVNPKQPAAARVPVTAPGWADQLAEYFHMPARLFFHAGHTWARVDGADTVTVGMNEFARKLVGPLNRVQLPAVGASLAQGMPALAVEADGRAVEMLSPVDGTVVAVNPRLAQSADAVNDAPYADGWLFQVKSPKLAANLKNLMSGTLARRWMDTVCETLGGEMQGLELGRVYLDGGAPVDGLARNLSPEHWDELARRFFLTEQGGPHA